MRIYLDTCCYNRPFDEQKQEIIRRETHAKMEIQKMIRHKKLELVTSYILETENAENPYDGKRLAIKGFVDAHSTIFVSEENSGKVEKMSREIEQTGVHIMDACHVACAILAGCDVFITTDKRLLKYHTDAIRLMKPEDFLAEKEDKT